jgi:tetratricopeptide (TPR) repeat protein
VRLAEQSNQGAHQIAIALLRRIISDFADVWYEVNFSHEMLGHIHENDDRFEEAEREYRWVVGAYAKGRSGTSALCDLTLAELIIRTDQSAKFDEAVRLLEQAAGNITFNSDWFRYWVAAARLAELLGLRDDAATFAGKALGLAQVKQPQFPRHPTLDIVRADSGILAEMRMLTTPSRQTM